ncbi:MAG: hypothetical protein K6G23_05735 [Lachnospiraceae bacterium]|nr:hypothetical protein [Lachnospiraceae bacterium]
MKIASSNLVMDSARTYKQTSAHRQSASQTTFYSSGIMMSGLTGTESLQYKEQQSGNQALLQEPEEDQAIDFTGKEEFEAWNERFSLSTAKVASITESRSDHMMTLRQKMIQFIIALLFEVKGGDKTGNDASDPLEQLTRDLESKGSPMSMTVVSDTKEQSYFAEYEQTAFAVQGTVLTEDGRSLDVNMNVQMSRSFAQYYESHVQSISEIELIDPLVIQLATGATSIADQTFFFDLDADGEKEEIHELAQGSGFLALDRNADGTINDGSELFGTKSGNGFADLMIYDEDGNGWIDENDDIWDKLKIWTKDEHGKDVLYTLRQSGVGAICLSSAPTEFTDTDEEGTVRGQVRQSGFFLFEDATMGSIQQIDLATGG